jgi:hypothetical protein
MTAPLAITIPQASAGPHRGRNGDAADSDDHAFSSSGGDRLAVDQVRGYRDEVPLWLRAAFGWQCSDRH